MILTKAEEAMANGSCGPGIKKCMEILIKFGEAFGAKKMVRISSAHVIPNVPIELLKEMTDGITRPAVFTTLHPHMSAFSPDSWKSMGICNEYAVNNIDTIEQRGEIFKKKDLFRRIHAFQQWLVIFL